MKSQKRYTTNSKDTTLIAVWMPTALARQLDAAAKSQDLDRSKLIRRVLRQTLIPTRLV